MIEWVRWEPGTPAPTKEFYLVTNGKSYVDVAYCEKNMAYGYTWWDRENRLCAGITHYAEINWPKAPDSTE